MNFFGCGVSIEGMMVSQMDMRILHCVGLSRSGVNAGAMGAGVGAAGDGNIDRGVRLGLGNVQRKKNGKPITRELKVKASVLINFDSALE